MQRNGGKRFNMNHFYHVEHFLGAGFHSLPYFWGAGKSKKKLSNVCRFWILKNAVPGTIVAQNSLTQGFEQFLEDRYRVSAGPRAAVRLPQRDGTARIEGIHGAQSARDVELDAGAAWQENQFIVKKVTAKCIPGVVRQNWEHR